MFVKRRLLLATLCAVAASSAWSLDAYPTKPVRFVVPFAAGGESDIVARLVSTKLQARGYTVLVDNRPGAGGNLGAEQALRDPPDGYTLLVISGAYAGNAVVMKPSFDPLGAIQPIAQFSRQPSVLVVSTASGFKTLKELIDKARQSPGTITYGSAGVGSLGNLAGEYFASAAGVKLMHIPYKGTSGGMTDLAGGQIDMMTSGITAARSLAKSGKIRVLAISGAKRLPELPEVPTFAEAGVPDFEIGLWHGLVASKDVPAPIVSKLNADVNEALRDPEIQSRFTADALTPVGGTPEQFRGVIRGDMERWRRIVKEANIKVQ